MLVQEEGGAQGKHSAEVGWSQSGGWAFRLLCMAWSSSTWEFLWKFLEFSGPNSVCVFPLVGTGTMTIGDHRSGTACAVPFLFTPVLSPGHSA